jgi:hypothetical protein
METLKSITFPTSTKAVPACFMDGYQFFYEIKPGDTLNEIISDFYSPMGDDIRKAITAQIKKNNPDIVDINMIYTGQVLYLKIPFRNEIQNSPIELSSIIEIKNDHKSLTPLQKRIKEDFVSSQKFDFTKPSLTFSGGTSNTLSKSIHNTNNILEEMIINYKNYATHKIGKKEYNIIRKQLKSSIKQRSFFRQGAFDLTAPQGKRVRKILAINPKSKSLGLFAKEAKNISRFSKIASKSATVLGFLEIGVTGYQVMKTDNCQEKINLSVGQVGSTTGGMAAGAAATFFLASNPFGWFVVATVGAASLVGSLASEEIVNWGYNKFGNSTNTKIIDYLKEERICHD